MSKWGGPLNPPLDNVVESKRLRSGGVNILSQKCSDERKFGIETL